MEKITDYIPQLPERKRSTKPPYRKPQSIKDFEEEYMRWHYRGKEHIFTPEMRIKPTFRDDKANGLTKLIEAWLKVKGHFGGRVNTMGTYNVKLGKFITSGSRKGMADITAVMNGRHVSIEVKIGNDKPREAQLKVQQQIQQAGGVYIFVSSFDDFINQIRERNLLR